MVEALTRTLDLLVALVNALSAHLDVRFRVVVRKAAINGAAVFATDWQLG